MTTDNGANYVVAFEHYSVEVQRLRDNLNRRLMLLTMVELDQEPEEVPLPDEDGELLDPAAVSVVDALHNVNQDPNMMEWFFHQDLELPKHLALRCHTPSTYWQPGIRQSGQLDNFPKASLC